MPNKVQSGGVGLADWLELTKGMNVGAYGGPTSIVTALTDGGHNEQTKEQENDPAFGTHLKEAGQIIKQWWNEKKSR